MSISPAPSRGLRRVPPRFSRSPSPLFSSPHAQPLPPYQPPDISRRTSSPPPRVSPYQSNRVPPYQSNRVSPYQNNRVRKAEKIDDDSRKGIKRRRTRKSQVHKYSPQLSQLLALEGRLIDSLRGKEAADLGTKLHSYLRGCSEDSTEYATVLKLLQDLCSSSGELPSSYKLDNITFDRGELIGKGGEASIYSGYFSGQRVVVREVVMPRKNWRSTAGQNIIKLIHREVITHSQLVHPNIIRLYGVFYEHTDAAPIMVLHYAEKGSLRDLIDVQAIRDVEFARITTGMGRALTYLHSRKPPIFHGDLHTDNVLIDAAGNALLCDFGLSRIRHEVTRTHTIIREGGRTRFLAPELLSGAEKFRTSSASDIFSLSMIFWNAWTRKLPFAELTNELRAEAAIRNGERPNRPTAASSATADVEQVNLSPEMGRVNLSPLSEQIDWSPESEQVDLSPELEQIDLSPESEQIALPPELVRNILPPKIEQDFWLLLVDMWAHEVLSRPSSQEVLGRLETMFRFLLELHE